MSYIEGGKRTEQLLEDGQADGFTLIAKSSVDERGLKKKRVDAELVEGVVNERKVTFDETGMGEGAGADRRSALVGEGVRRRTGGLTAT